MLKKGTRIRMTKGYAGVQGEVLEPLDSLFEFYVVRLENGIHLVAGPAAFEALAEGAEP